MFCIGMVRRGRDMVERKVPGRGDNRRSLGGVKE